MSPVRSSAGGRSAAIHRPAGSSPASRDRRDQGIEAGGRHDGALDEQQLSRAERGQMRGCGAGAGNAANRLTQELGVPRDEARLGVDGAPDVQQARHRGLAEPRAEAVRAHASAGRIARRAGRRRCRHPGDARSHAACGSQNATASETHSAMPDASRSASPGSRRDMKVTQASKPPKATTTSPMRASSPGPRRAESTSPPPSTTLTPSSFARHRRSPGPGSARGWAGPRSRRASRRVSASSGNRRVEQRAAPERRDPQPRCGTIGPRVHEVAGEVARLVDAQHLGLNALARRAGR